MDDNKENSQVNTRRMSSRDKTKPLRLRGESDGDEVPVEKSNSKKRMNNKLQLVSLNDGELSYICIIILP